MKTLQGNYLTLALDIKYYAFSCDNLKLTVRSRILSFCVFLRLFITDLRGTVSIASTTFILLSCWLFYSFKYLYWWYSWQASLEFLKLQISTGSLCLIVKSANAHAFNTWRISISKNSHYGSHFNLIWEDNLQLSHFPTRPLPLSLGIKMNLKILCCLSHSWSTGYFKDLYHKFT